MIFYLLNTNLSPIRRLSISSAYLSMFYLVFALIVGPVNVVRLNKLNPISIYMRRDLGIWSGLTAIFHTIAGLQVHFGGKFWLYFIYPESESHLIPLRYDFFGLTNYIGLFSAGLMLVLVLLSNDYSIKKIGARPWKKVQRWTYLLIPALPLHGIIYQVLDKRTGSYTLLLGLITLLVLVWQLTGFTKLKAKKQ